MSQLRLGRIYQLSRTVGRTIETNRQWNELTKLSYSTARQDHSYQLSTGRYRSYGGLQTVANSNWLISPRWIHLSRQLWDKPPEPVEVVVGKSKAEQTLKLLREDLTSQVNLQKKTENAVAVPKKSLWQKTKDECRHYYHGFRLLFIDFRIAARLLWQLLNGHQMTRREKSQLVRTTSDLFRLVPFLVFVIVPFMEFTLPIFLKLFPNMLPSTFQEQKREDEKIRGQLKVRLEMAKFLQATLEELSLQNKGVADQSKTAEFAEFIKQIRSGDSYVSNEELMKFSKVFEDELTLDNLSVSQLRAICKIVGITPVGPSNLLRFQLQMKLRELKADDKMIKKEGLDSLSILELQQACRARGMRALGLSEYRLKQQLSQWLELSLNEKVPPSLLLLSRTLFLPEDVDFKDRLKTIISSLPESVANEAKMKLSEIEGGKIDNKAKLELVKSIESAIRNERSEVERLKKEQKIKEAEKLAAEKEKLKEVPTEKVAKVPVTPEILVDPAMAIADKAKEMAVLKADVHPEELRAVEEVLETIKGPLAEEKEELKDLKEDLQEYKEDVKEVKSIVLMKGGRVEESKAAKRLQSRVNKIIGNVDSLIDQLHSEKQLINKEIKTAETTAMEESIIAQMDIKADAGETKEKKQNLISINELLIACKKLKKVTDEVKVQRILDVLNALDEDHDGTIDINLAMEVIELLGQENVKINSEQMTKILEMLKKEDKLEAEGLAAAKSSDSTSKQQPIGGIMAAGRCVDAPPLAPVKYEFLDHTADVQIHSWGDSLAEAFEQAAVAMFAYMTEIDKVTVAYSFDIEAKGDDLMSLFYHFLDEWLFAFSADPNFIAVSVKILDFDRDNFTIRARGWGESFDLTKHPQGTEVKAITYSNMQIVDTDDKHEVYVIIDI